MVLEDKLKELNAYNIAFEIKQGYYHISLEFNKKWTVITPEVDYIYVENRDDVTHYIASIGETSLNELFQTIDSTIDYNIDLEKKLLLFKEKTNELQEIFSKETYDVLKTIKFVFGVEEVTTKTNKKNNVKRKKTTKEKKEEETVVNEVKTEPVVEETVVDKETYSERIFTDCKPEYENVEEEGVENYEEELLRS